MKQGVQITVKRLDVHVRIHQENTSLGRKHKLTERLKEIVRGARTEGLPSWTRQLILQRSHSLMDRGEDYSMIRNPIEIAGHTVNGDFKEDRLRTVPRRNQRGRAAKPSKLLLAVRTFPFQSRCCAQVRTELLEEDQSVH